MDAKRLLAVPDGFVEAALSFPDKVDRMIARIDNSKGARELLIQADGLAEMARRIKSKTRVTNAITYGKAKIAAKYAELVPAIPPKISGARKGKGTSTVEVPFAPATMALYRKILKYKDRLRDYFEADGEDPEERTLAGFVRATTELSAAIRRDWREREAEADAAKAETESDDKAIHVGDFREHGQLVKDNSVDLIFTDPPYDAETVPQYGDLAQFGARVLIPGGSLICYVGHYAVADVMRLMDEHLRYWWLNAIVHTGGNKAFPGKFVFVGWKPLLWYVKERRATKTLIRDCIKSTPGDKEVHHEWAQGETEAAYYIEHLSRPKSLIVDPYSGGGTTGAVAVKMGRRFKGFDINAAAARRAEGRIAKCLA